MLNGQHLLSAAHSFPPASCKSMFGTHLHRMGTDTGPFALASLHRAECASFCLVVSRSGCSSFLERHTTVTLYRGTRAGMTPIAFSINRSPRNINLQISRSCPWQLLFPSYSLVKPQRTAKPQTRLTGSAALCHKKYKYSDQIGCSLRSFHQIWMAAS